MWVSSLGSMLEEMATDFVKSSRSFLTVTAGIDSLLVRTR
jgi:hypothetical protein